MKARFSCIVTALSGARDVLLYLRGPEEVQAQLELHLSGVKGECGGEQQQREDGLQTASAQQHRPALTNTHLQ